MSRREKDWDDQLAEGCLGAVFWLIGAGIAAAFGALMASIGIWSESAKLTEEAKLLRLKPGYTVGVQIDSLTCPTCQAINETDVRGVICYYCGEIITAPPVKKIQKTMSEELADIPPWVSGGVLFFVLIAFLCFACTVCPDMLG